MMNYLEFKSKPLQSEICRRKFLKTSVAGEISMVYIPLTANIFSSGRSKPKYELSLDSPARFFDGESCRVHPQTGIVHGGGKDGLPRIVMTMNSLDLSGSDVFRGIYGLETDNPGRTWTSPQELDTPEQTKPLIYDLIINILAEKTCKTVKKVFSDVNL